MAKRSPDPDDITVARELFERSARIICDFDDTLVATYRVRAGTLARTAARFGVHIDNERVAAVWGAPFPELVSSLLPGVAVEDFLRLYKIDMQNDHPLAQPGALALLQRCRQQAKTLLVHSSSQTDLVRQDLAELHWAEFVDAIFGIDRTVYAKPDPRSMDAPLGWLRSKFGDLAGIVYIGDSPNDFKVAHARGLPFIGVLSGLSADIGTHGTAAPTLHSLEDLFPAAAR